MTNPYNVNQRYSDQYAMLAKQPVAPSEDGEYTLKLKVENGIVSAYWEKEETANNLVGSAIVGTAIAG